MSERRGHPKEIVEDIRAAERLEWWNIGWTITIIAVMGLAMGSSQAMRTAWVEDALGLVPPIAFLVAARYEERASDAHFHYGFDRVNGLGFLIAAVALAAVGLLLFKDAVTALTTAEHVTIGSVRIWGHDVWLGWAMMGAQAYATIPPLIIGRKELPLAKRLRDKLLHTDALMNKANWQTGVAGFLGVAGLGFGWWWADSGAAILISASIIWDGWKALKIATSELVDGVPCALEEPKLSAEAKAVSTALRKEFPKSKVLLRETGRYIRAEVIGVKAPEEFDTKRFEIPGLKDRWRLESIAFRP
ncbi:cation transporter [Sphingobium phenoxybenzoativorans]|uniref:Cation transporter n=1 Tax=Sphingobium phenoxybenzoativorans TaxID=1592790 RepID=A0A975Q0Z0_9SPHN|nr:cation transporter [Sphingobium phenoxybenzoativorans]QUT05111.1 cation transporter [Sphingobium phenoxybenzoativorans]